MSKLQCLDLNLLLLQTKSAGTTKATSPLFATNECNKLHQAL